MGAIRSNACPEKPSPQASDFATPRDGGSWAEGSDFASPLSIASCSRSPTHFSEQALAGKQRPEVDGREKTNTPNAADQGPDDRELIHEGNAASSSHGWQNKTRHFQKCEVGVADDNTFRVVRRLLGPAGENLKHIIERSKGAKVWICGQGSRH